MTNLYKILFLKFMIIGTMISISSISWILAWMGMEVNLLAFLPLLKKMKKKNNTEMSLKYFITQAMASSILLFSIIITLNLEKSLLDYTSIFTDMALMLKLGIAPMHFWLVEIMSKMEWNLIIILSTWQKIAPMLLIFYSSNNLLFISLMIIISSIFSSIQGLNQICLRKILAYSSINHMSWMMSALLISPSIWWCYFTFYSLANINFITLLQKYKIFYLNQLSNLLSFNKTFKFLFMMNLFSLGGLPPFMGFFPKWLVINLLVQTKLIFMATMTILFSLISLFFYIRVCFSTLMLFCSNSSISTKMNLSFLSMTTNFLSMLTLLWMPLLLKFF
uniref:NADH-ubiquinone oxidoreductase chain 2 n=1 Tax=Curculionoidea sp. 31 KM-2017 TaxID=2219416 RepID=A0A346RJC4_9CUCU|nr:NADH dehydrogenase subunit 2 [Curculionoidea sp. 31 KM-2017]